MQWEVLHQYHCKIQDVAEIFYFSFIFCIKVTVHESCILFLEDSLKLFLGPGVFLNCSQISAHFRESKTQNHFQVLRIDTSTSTHRISFIYLRKPQTQINMTISSYFIFLLTEESFAYLNIFLLKKNLKLLKLQNQGNNFTFHKTKCSLTYKILSDAI